MAETWTYEVIWNEPQNIQIPDKQGNVEKHPYVNVKIRRADNTEKDGSFYEIVSGSLFSSNVNVATWNSGQLVVTSYGTTATIAENTSDHIITNIGFTPTDAILSVGSSYVNTTVTRNTGSNQTIMIYGGTGGAVVFTIKVQVQYKYSKSTISGGDASFGGTSTVTITGHTTYTSDLTHEVKWTVYGNNTQYTRTETRTNTGDLSTTIPSSWMNAVPNNTTISCSLELKTYKGTTLIGTDTDTCTLTVPDSEKPTIGSITCTIRNENAGIPNTYIQNTTGVYIQVNNATAGTGATLTDNFVISANVTETYIFDSANRRFTVDKLANYGEITFSVSVRDSRGRQSTPVTATITVMEYALPVIDAVTAYRCRSTGIADDEGTYACIRIVVSYTQTGGNTIDIDSTYYRSDIPSQKYTAQNNMESGVSYIIGNNTLDPSHAYFVQFTIEDSLGNIITRDVRVQTSAFAIHIKNGGTGVAVGKASEVANSFEINEGWDMYYKGVIVLPVIYSTIEPGTGASTITPFEGLVWLEPKT